MLPQPHMMCVVGEGGPAMSASAASPPPGHCRGPPPPYHLLGSPLHLYFVLCDHPPHLYVVLCDHGTAGGVPSCRDPSTPTTRFVMCTECDFACLA